MFKQAAAIAAIFTLAAPAIANSQLLAYDGMSPCGYPDWGDLSGFYVDPGMYLVEQSIERRFVYLVEGKPAEVSVKADRAGSFYLWVSEPDGPAVTLSSASDAERERYEFTPEVTGCFVFDFRNLLDEETFLDVVIGPKVAGKTKK